MRTLAVVALAALSLHAAPTIPPKPDDKPLTPEEMPYATKVQVDKGDMTFAATRIRYVTEQRTRQVNDNGKIVNVIEQVMVPVLETVMMKLDPKAATVKVDGKEIAEADLAKLFQEKADVVVSPAGKPLPKDQAEKVKGKPVIYLKPAKK